MTIQFTSFEDFQRSKSLNSMLFFKREKLAIEHLFSNDMAE